MGEQWADHAASVDFVGTDPRRLQRGEWEAFARQGSTLLLLQVMNAQKDAAARLVWRLRTLLLVAMS